MDEKGSRARRNGGEDFSGSDLKKMKGQQHHRREGEEQVVGVVSSKSEQI